jgi:hypothetical protein
MRRDNRIANAVTGRCGNNVDQEVRRTSRTVDTTSRDPSQEHLASPRVQPSTNWNERDPRRKNPDCQGSYCPYCVANRPAPCRHRHHHAAGKATRPPRSRYRTCERVLPSARRADHLHASTGGGAEVLSGYGGSERVRNDQKPGLAQTFDFGGCGGPQPLAGKQVAGLLLRDPDLNS